MNIYTGYFAQMKKYQELGLTPISIARYSPVWFTGYCLKDLAPSDSLLKGYKDGQISIEEYREQYLQQLETVRWAEVLRSLPQTEQYCVAMRNPVISVTVIFYQNI